MLDRDRPCCAVAAHPPHLQPASRVPTLVEEAGGSIGRGIGMILSVLSGFVVFAGAFLGFKESGGDFGDLKDMNKLKASFQGSGGSESSPPPPPPPGMTPPPPPPPPV